MLKFHDIKSEQISIIKCKKKKEENNVNAIRQVCCATLSNNNIHNEKMFATKKI